MVESTSDSASPDSQDVMISAYRHDAHKFTGEPHESAPETIVDVPVNQTVPRGADADASALSRPSGQPEQTVDTHVIQHRLSLRTGERYADTGTVPRPAQSPAIRDLLTTADPVALHRAWLTSEVARMFNESVYYPYTSLKYHTLLVAALLDNYRAGYEFTELRFVLDPADVIVPHRTVYTDEAFALRIDGDAGHRPAARLGARPWRSWASTWSRLPAHPLDTDDSEYAMVVDANLRRIGAWSTALQYLEDVAEEFER